MLTLQEWFDNPARCLIIGEIAQTHDGSLGTAHAYIDAVANAGADAIKFQTHIAAAESTPGEPWRVKFSRQDATRFAYWQRMEFSEEQWHGLAAHARERGLLFLSSAFSPEAVDLLERVGVPGWKVGAGEVGNLPLLEKMARTGNPVILSSGMSDWAELDAAVHCVREHGAAVAVLQCTTAYPCPPEKLGLNVLAELRARYDCPIGLSDHSGVIYAGLAAATLGAKLLEVHVAFSRECFGPDVVASLTTPELKQLVEGVRFIETALAAPVDKQEIADSLCALKQVFGKSIVAARDLPAGHCVTLADLAFKKPGTGIPAARYQELLARTLARAVVADAQLTEED
ncbi:MAG: N-acetylneuraminate synthase family protein, partial [Acidobacteria bacterium]|nr:N-acetylneuraminate synthase family protein [Acidobacteriota bacterium]